VAASKNLFLWIAPGLFLLSPIFAVAAEVALVVKGENKTLQLSLTEIQALPRTKLVTTDRNGATNVYEGVVLHEILRRTDTPQGEALRGEALMLSVSVKATDGYGVIFSLAELDPLFSDHHVLLAYRRDDAALDPKDGPLRLVIPEEKRRGRWVRQVSDLQILKPATSK
jgi:hypothetical protein